MIVNTARGKVVVEEDLAEALKAGKVRAYATDVWASDPPDTASPLLSAPNTIFTPHLGASTAENMQRIGVMVEGLIRDYAARP